LYTTNNIKITPYYYITIPTYAATRTTHSELYVIQQRRWFKF